MNPFRVIIRETREGFRLLVAWLIGFISFGVLSEVSVRVISYLEPWKLGRTARDEGDLVLLWSVAGLGVLVLSGTSLFEGLRLRREH